MSDIHDILLSWKEKEGINSNSDIINWVDEKNKKLKVIINKTGLNEIDGWFLDSSGMIKNINDGFFSVVGIRKFSGKEQISGQPIILQDEIGFLGIICKKIDGVLHFLMQAKIEPGNINKIQISPTIQATKSNFEKKHGGKTPKYLNYFLNTDEYNIIVDQIQSEQSERFYKKRNRNIIIDIGDHEIEVVPSHMWMTLGQIKWLMKIDNLVNMDTRTVLSCIPFMVEGETDQSFVKYFENIKLHNSIFNSHKYELSKIYKKLNDYKMFCNTKTKFCRLDELDDWNMSNEQITCRNPHNYKVIFCNLEIEGREVRTWGQPLFEATGSALFVLFVSVIKGKYEFLVKLMPEIGTFDKVELGPTIQNEFMQTSCMPINEVDDVYLSHIASGNGIMYDVLLSEEGGRFYQEQNRNVIIEIDKSELKNIPNEYSWVDYKTLNLLQQSNNVLNIQLRNLLSLLEV